MSIFLPSSVTLANWTVVYCFPFHVQLANTAASQCCKLKALDRFWKTSKRKLPVGDSFENHCRKCSKFMLQCQPRTHGSRIFLSVLFQIKHNMKCYLHKTGITCCCIVRYDKWIHKFLWMSSNASEMFLLSWFFFHSYRYMPLAHDDDWPYSSNLSVLSLDWHSRISNAADSVRSLYAILLCNFFASNTFWRLNAQNI